MKPIITYIVTALALFSCKESMKINESSQSSISVVGTWKLISATLIEKNDTVVTAYNKNISFIKIINDTHFAFLQHDLNKGKDTTAVYSSGGGSYSLIDNKYTEHLEYCSDRNWENNNFEFTVQLKNDTFIQSGIEKVESAGVNRMNIEKYVRVKK